MRYLCLCLVAFCLTAASELLGIHIQLDNANTTVGYTLYADDWTVYSW